MPTVDVNAFQEFTGLALSDDEYSRIKTLLDRARRTINDQIRLPSDLEANEDSLADYTDAVCELAWYYWEQEKAGVMEIHAQPLAQLSLGGLFWTKSSNDPELPMLTRIIQKWGIVYRSRIVLEGELDYPA